MDKNEFKSNKIFTSELWAKLRNCHDGTPFDYNTIT